MTKQTNQIENGIHFRSLRIENTNLCKYVCVMCPREKLTRKQGIMNMQDYQLVLDRIQEYIDYTNLPQPFSSAFHLHGYGEPLFDPNLMQKAAIVTDQFPISRTIIYTTLGVRRPESYLKNLLVKGKIKGIFVSFYGFQESTYDIVHKGGDFHTARKNLIYLAKLNAELGHPCSLRVQLLQPHTVNLIRNDPKEEKAFNEFYEALSPYGIELQTIGLHNYGDGRDFIDTEKIQTVCSVVDGVRKTDLNVSWQLKIVPCCFDSNNTIVFGDLREQSIYEIYHSEKYKKFI